MKRYPRVFDRSLQIRWNFYSIPFHSIRLKNLTGSRIANLTVKIAQAVDWSLTEFWRLKFQAL